MKYIQSKLFYLTISLLSLAMFFSSSYAQDTIEPTKVELISNLDTLKPGESFLIGVRFSMDPGWHIYGRAPGELGLPTKIALNLEPGFKAAEMIWPKEESFSLGSTKGLGYSGTVIVASSIETNSAEISSDSTTINAVVSWLNCSEKICIPAKKKLALKLKLTKDSRASIYANEFQDLNR